MIACHMDDVAVRLTCIEKTISTLHTRLSSVIQPDRPSDKKKNTEGDSPILMIAQLVMVKDRLEAINDFLLDIMGRLEV